MIFLCLEFQPIRKQDRVNGDYSFNTIAFTNLSSIEAVYSSLNQNFNYEGFLPILNTHKELLPIVCCFYKQREDMSSKCVCVFVPKN